MCTFRLKLLLISRLGLYFVKLDRSLEQWLPVIMDSWWLYTCDECLVYCFFGQFILIVALVNYQPMHNPKAVHVLPEWGDAIGWVLIMVAVVQLPLWAAVAVYQAKGVTLKEVMNHDNFSFCFFEKNLKKQNFFKKNRKKTKKIKKSEKFTKKESMQWNREWVASIWTTLFADYDEALRRFLNLINQSA